MVVVPLGQQISGEKLLCNFSQRGNREYVRATALQTLRSVEKDGEEVLQVPEQIPLQTLVQPTVRQLCPCSPGRSTGEQRSTCNPWRDPMLEQVDA